MVRRFRKGKSLVPSKKQALLKDTPDKSDLKSSKEQRGIVAQENSAKLGTEIEVMSFFPEEAVHGDVIDQEDFFQSP